MTDWENGIAVLLVEYDNKRAHITLPIEEIGERVTSKAPHRLAVLELISALEKWAAPDAEVE